MIRVTKISVLLFTLFFVESQISLHKTNDGLGVQFYDCHRLQSLDYCRRPKQPVDLIRDEDTEQCERNGGQLHTFSELRSNSTNVDVLIQQSTFTLEQLEGYSLFLQHPNRTDGSICRCSQPGSFGKNCEYQLPVNRTFEDALEWQLMMRKENQEKVQIHGDVVCYVTLACDSGVLCLDWREICDGIQHCLEGRDEENCDFLEMNRCHPEEEYRCENGMCIPEEFFLDGELDCLDWSDEIQPKNDDECPLGSVSTDCDDHLCLFGLWSCGDGQCFPDRLMFQRETVEQTCHSGRDQYFMCETHRWFRQWTMPNGRCFRSDDQYEPFSVTNHSDEEQCEYLLKCALSTDMEKNCSCNDDWWCIDDVPGGCRSSLIRYPLRAFVTPFTFFLYHRQRVWSVKLPDLLEINGTVRCRDAMVTVLGKRIPFDHKLDPQRMIEEHFCGPTASNVSSSPVRSIPHPTCHHENESTDLCHEWNRCLSNARIRDGVKNCLNGTDELFEQESETDIETSCARVRRHRFRCSNEETSCLSLRTLGDQTLNCRNGFDEVSLSIGRIISSIRCNKKEHDECSLLRQYIQQSSTARATTSTVTENDPKKASAIPFRFHCDTFDDLWSRDDEHTGECQQWWICLEDQHRCRTGQCIPHRWISDHEWDCLDASDEYGELEWSTRRALQGSLQYDFTNRSFFVPSSCDNQSHPFLCLSTRAIQQGFKCFNLSQIADGNIDCAGGIDERNTRQQCSQSSSSVLGPNFLCPSTNSCIPYYSHCSKDEYRCPNRADDEFWCSRQWRSPKCSDLNDFVCFDGECFKGGRCNQYYECPFHEDEYMCDRRSLAYRTFVPYREHKRISPERRSSILHLSRYTTEIDTKELDSHPERVISASSSSLSPYWCNRGLGVVSTNDHSTILCFCPPHYYGEKCEFHSDRLSVVLHLNLSESFELNRNDRRFFLHVVVHFLYNDGVLNTDQFRLHPSAELDSLVNSHQTRKKTKLISHFVYPRSSPFLDDRRERFFNRSSLLSRSPFSIRVELYRTRLNERPSVLAIWKYPLDFAHLPVSRLSKVLRFTSSSLQRSPCSSNPCPRNEQCHQLMNNNSAFICLCRENCSRADQQCPQGYCMSRESLCQLNSQRRNATPFCLCPLNRYGLRCSIEHDVCLSNPCQNDGSCFPDRELNQFICVCLKGFFGSQCERSGSSIHFFLSTDLRYRGVVLQVLLIDLSSLELVLLQQQVFLALPQRLDYYHQDQSSITGILVAKVYSSAEVSVADLHLLSVYEQIFSIDGRTNLSSINRCEHRRTFVSQKDYSAIRYHQICIDHPTRLCFRDDQYLCICAENHTRVECFLYDDQLDRCSHCLANGRCLKGDSDGSNDFICLCPECHSGQQCQFSTRSFSITLDQLFSADLLSTRRRQTISSIIFFPLVGLFLAIPNNLFTFITLRRRSCLRQGVGYYLLAMSVVNQTILFLLLARLIHLIVIMTISRSSSLVDHLLCKLLNYLLTCLTRLSSWLPSFVALERAFTTLFINKQWFKRPGVARSLMGLTVSVILLSTGDELAFVKSFTSIADESRAMCVIDYPSRRRSMWIFIHQVVAVCHILFPLLINLCSTLTIMSIVIRSKMNIRANEAGRTAFRSVLNENREMITRPAITLVPSIFSLFSLPFLIISFSLGCRNLDDSPLRYVLLTFYFVTFVPQVFMFYLYIYPSSFYRKEWQSTTISQRITTLRRHQTLNGRKTLSIIHENKD